MYSSGSNDSPSSYNLIIGVSVGSCDFLVYSEAKSGLPGIREVVKAIPVAFKKNLLSNVAISDSYSVKKFRPTFGACRRPLNRMTLPAEPHNKYIFIYRRGQHDAGLRQAKC